MKRLLTSWLLAVSAAGVFAQEPEFDERRIVREFLAKQSEKGRVWKLVEPGYYIWIAQNGQEHRVGFGPMAKRVRADYLSDQIRMLESKRSALDGNVELSRMRGELESISSEMNAAPSSKSFGNCANVRSVFTWVAYEGDAAFCSVSGISGFKIFNPTPVTTAYLDVEVFINTPSSDLKQIARGNFTAVSEGIGTDTVSLSASNCQDVGGYSRATFQSCSYEQAYSVGTSF